MSNQLSPREASLMRHACGANSKTPYYRNYFAADPGSKDDVAWAGLVAKGMAMVMRESCRIFPNRFYSVTDLGKQAIGEYSE
jgi:hypothetical protein